MCGIFGIVVGRSGVIPPAVLKTGIEKMFYLSESRGKEASGLAILSGQSIHLYKQPVAASVMVKTGAYKALMDNHVCDAPVAIIGHTRLVTGGAQSVNCNNQPVAKGGMAGVHNGIVVNDKELWGRYKKLKRLYEVDTEVILSLIKEFSKDRSLAESVRATFELIEGTASVAMFFNDMRQLLLSTNNGSLYYLFNTGKNLFIFASERQILIEFIKSNRLKEAFNPGDIKHLSSEKACFVDLDTLSLTWLSLKGAETGSIKLQRNKEIDIVDLSPEDKERVPEKDKTAERRQPYVVNASSAANSDSIASLRRCVKCILPETMPLIHFDDTGVCSYCKRYRVSELKGVEALEKIASKYRSGSGAPDCIVGVSGGRDSIYGLHYIKTVLKMNPVAYTYDWGMVTDLARRNIARICGQLGIEHIIVSADINKKREFIRKNVTAWLKKPALGVIPLFMAGDKQYFYYLSKLKEEMKIELAFLCENLLERTDFKTGFSKIQPGQVDSERVYTLSRYDKVRLLAYYGKQYLINPSYINASLLDTLFAYASFYLIKRDYFNPYRFIQWDENVIVPTLINEYGWELAKDTVSTWRIGDGTSAFYNYIYYTVAGFTENDTFRSNQIREGVISRKEALERVNEENKPRYDSIRWYCDTIGVDFKEALRIIDTTPKLYRRI